MDTAVVPTPSVSSFPSEILGEIFLASIPPLGRTGSKLKPRASFPWLLTHVSRHWRESALAFPQLWSFLDLEQTQENQDRNSPSVHCLDAYLQRSGQQPLTFRLAYSEFTMHGHPFLEFLLQHPARWEDVCIESPPVLAREILTRCNASDFPSLLSLTLFQCILDSHNGGLVRWIPWSQLKRYREYSCWWRGDYTYQWSTLGRLTSIVDLRVDSEYGSVAQGVIRMPNLRFASFLTHTNLGVENLLNCLDIPKLQGLCLDIVVPGSRNILCPMHSQLKSLKVLKLLGAFNISNEGLTYIFTELTELTDLTTEPHSRSFDAEHIFTLLTPTTESVLVPKLQSLRVTQFPYSSRVAAALLAMLHARFDGITGVEFIRLRLFSLYIRNGSPDIIPAAMMDTLRSKKAIEGWNVQVYENWAEIWGLDEEFL